MKPTSHYQPSSSPSVLDRILVWLQEHSSWLRHQLSEPSAVLFARIRLRLLAWYIGILSTILVIAGLLLYIGMEISLLGPVNNALAVNAATASQTWQTTGTPPCASQSFTISNKEVIIPNYFACYDPNNQLISSDALIGDAPPFAIAQFTQANLVQSALASGSATDIVDGGNTTGAIARYALTVRTTDGTVLGVLQVGYPVQEYENSLHTLVSLLVLVGTLTVVGAGAGGWFLASRALEPARVATGRQRAFIADAAHELRTPLTLLRADAEALLFHRDHLPPDDVELVDDIVTESSYMTELASNLLTLARLDAGVTHLETDVLDLRLILSHVTQRVSALARQHGVTVTIAEAPEPVYVVGDRVLLEQATMILLDNAIKYNRPHGTVSLETSRHSQWAQIRVRDTGIGITATDLAHVGERFYRVDTAHTRANNSGAGLGVSIARGIAAAHHGILTFTSVPDQGTTALLHIPAVVARTSSLRP